MYVSGSTVGFGLASFFLLVSTACMHDDASLSKSQARASGVQPPPGLGATYDANQANLTLRVYSAAATRIDVDFYTQPLGMDEVLSTTLTKDAATNVWTASVSQDRLAAAGLSGTIYYGYRAWGPNWPYDPAWVKGSLAGSPCDSAIAGSACADVDAQGNRFNPNKLLLDPYALEVSHDPINPRNTDASVFGVGDQNRGKDSGRLAPKALVMAVAAGAVGAKPTRALKDDVIYEVHLRGFTKSDAEVTAPCRGTFAGAAQKAAYLADLGVTTVEFLPVQEAQNAQNDLAASTVGANYWDYGAMNYFAPSRRYACDQSPGGPTREFQAMVKAFHDQGLKVFLDVVYNHTSENGVLSYRGLDNQTYYLLGNDRTTYQKVSAVPGAAVNTAHPVVRDLIMTSLHYWSEQLGVDGFRFDLGPILGNSCLSGCFKYDPADGANVLNRAVAELPVRPDGGGQGVDLIAEPWGPAYEIGNFPVGWANWNDHFRDHFRTSLNRQAGVAPAQLVQRVLGSPDLFLAGRGPAASINFIDCHDGFTLRDLNTYVAPENQQPWPFGPSDGGSKSNLSSDHGGDGDMQQRASRTGLALAVLAAGGVPMFQGGDEFYRTVGGNNNPYNLDSDKNWLDWTLPGTYPDVLAQARSLVRFRLEHPALRPGAFLVGARRGPDALKDIAFYRADGTEADATYLGAAAHQFLGYRVDGGPSADPAASLYVAYNWASQDAQAHLPPPQPGKQWSFVGSTGTVVPFLPLGGETPQRSLAFVVPPLAVSVFLEGRPDSGTTAYNY